MNLAHTSDKEFIQRLTEIVEANLGDENFGVEELVSKSGLGSNLIRHRLKTITKQTPNQFINKIRLNHALELLQESTLTAAEVGYKVGYSSSAYFNKCFHEHYGYPPGEVKRKLVHDTELTYSTAETEKQTRESEVNQRNELERSHRRIYIFAVTGILLVIALGYLSYYVFFSNHRSDSDGQLLTNEKSIALIPFKNLSDDKGNQYFADGIMEDILNRLFRIRELRVISRTSVEQFRGSSLGIPDIARKLGVNYILEGSVQRYQGKVRINVQLIDASKDQHIWVGKYDKELGDVLATQSEIAKQIAVEMQASLSSEEISQINEMPTQNPEAYNLYLKGRFFWNRRTKEGLMSSLEYFHKAVEADPDYALAYAGLADGYFIQSWWGWYKPRNEGYAKAKTYAIQAIKLNDNLAEAHATLGALFCWKEQKWEEARKELLLSIELNPNYATGRQYYAELLDIFGQKEEALSQMKIALVNDPFSIIMHNLCAHFYIDLELYNNALEECAEMKTIDKNFMHAYWKCFNIYVKQSDGDKALAEFRQIFKMDNSLAKYAGGDKIKEIYLKSGTKGLLNLIISIEQEASDPIIQYIAGWNLLLGDKESAIKWLEKEYEEKHPYIYYIIGTPEFKNIRSDPRFIAIVKKLGLLAYLKSAVADHQ